MTHKRYYAHISRKPTTLGQRIVCALIVATYGSAYANPIDPTVISGQASFQQQGATLTITNTPNAIINWQAFSIGASETTRFIQQSATSSVLNRVTGIDPSIILGSLQSNGQVLLINPNGMLFGQGARIDVAGLVASTLNLSNDDFLNGNLNFTGGALAGSLKNQGSISTPSGGSVLLIAPDVTNSGIITAPDGTVILAAGHSVRLGDTTAPNVLVEISAPESNAVNLGQIVVGGGKAGIYAGIVQQKGIVSADAVTTNAAGKIVFKATKDITLDANSRTTANGATGGQISVEATSGINLVAGLVEARGLPLPPGEGGGEGKGGAILLKGNVLIQTGDVRADGASGGTVTMQARNLLNAGRISADGFQGSGGEINLQASNNLIQTSFAELSANSVAGDGGSITIQAGNRVFSSTTASATSNGGKGGSVKVLGNEIVLLGAALDASGDTGGGTILVGGDFQGNNPEIQNALTTDINFSTTLKADAGNSGDGGKVIVWSDNQTQYYGDIAARGGSIAGNGGFIEVSGKQNLTFGGVADASAANGTQGSLLLDPKNIVIDSAGSGGLASFLLADPNQTAGGAFGDRILVLGNDNIVVADTLDDFVAANAGAAYLFNGINGALISTLNGSTANDFVGSGGITPLSNGNFVVVSSGWNGVTGAVTWGNGSTGFIGGSGPIDATNSLVGSFIGDSVGDFGITALTNGNYVVTSSSWDNTGGAAFNYGAVTWGNGAGGTVGVVSVSNSLVGSTTDDSVGNGGITELTGINAGKYVVRSTSWSLLSGPADVGAVTWVDGSNGQIAGGTAIGALVSAGNSLVGSTAGDSVGSGGITTLSNGNYLVRSSAWNGGVSPSQIGFGAVTWVNGTNGHIAGGTAVGDVVSASNSLVGSTLNDNVGNGGITALSNGNYVVSNSSWDDVSTIDVGAVTWVDGTNGYIAGGVIPGAAVSTANSLVGLIANDRVGSGGITELKGANTGKYVVSSYQWGGGAVEVGAVTWVNGANGQIAGGTAVGAAVSGSNSLVGSTAGDQVGLFGVYALSNGNYVVSSSFWDLPANALGAGSPAATDAGAVTWGDGTNGTTGLVSVANSLFGSATNDFVGDGGIIALNGANANYVVTSRNWNNGAATSAGAVTWVDGSNGNIAGSVSRAGMISPLNSLVGSNVGDQVGGGGVFALRNNGNYVVNSPDWDDGGLADVGAVTWVNGTNGFTFGASSPGETLSAANSLVGSTAGDAVGSNGIFTLSNGNYVVLSPSWDAGAVTNVGAVTWGDGATIAVTRLVGAVSPVSSLVGSTADDRVGDGTFTELANGNYVVASAFWDIGPALNQQNVGAITWVNGSNGTLSGSVSTGAAVSAVNSVVGSVTDDLVVDYCNDACGDAYVVPLSNGNYVVSAKSWDNSIQVDAGAVIFGNGNVGAVGLVVPSNSRAGFFSNDQLGSGGIYELSNGSFAVASPAADFASGVSSGLVQIVQPVATGFSDLVANATFADNPGGNSTITPATITAITNNGTAVVLHANNDIIVNSAVITNNTVGNGGDLTLQAGRSVLVNADIVTDNGNLTILANDPAADTANRDVGLGNIAMAAGTRLDAGTGTVSLQIGAGSNGGSITQGSGAKVIASLLSMNSVTGINMLGNNAVDSLNAFNSSSGNIDFYADLAPATGRVTLQNMQNTGGSVNLTINYPAQPISYAMGISSIYSASGTFNIQKVEMSGASVTSNGANFGGMTVSGGTNTLNTGNTLINALTLSGGISLNTGGTVTINALAGVGAFNVTGGTTNLSGANHTGTTSVNGGVLNFLGGSLGTVNVGAAGSQFYVTGIGSTQALNVSGGAVGISGSLTTMDLNLTSGSVGGTGNLTVSNDFLQSGGTLGTTFTNLNLTRQGLFTVAAYDATNSLSLTAAGGDLVISNLTLDAPIINLSGANVSVDSSTVGSAATTNLSVSTPGLLDVTAVTAASSVRGNTVIVSADTVTVTGGTGTDFYAAIFGGRGGTTVTALSTINLFGGAGPNADSLILAGNGLPNVTPNCTGCVVLLDDPFIDPLTNVGLFDTSVSMVPVDNSIIYAATLAEDGGTANAEVGEEEEKEDQASNTEGTKDDGDKQKATLPVCI